MFDPALIPFVQRLDRDPYDEEALSALWDALDVRGDHHTLAVLAEKIAGRRDPSRGADLLHRAATLYATQLHRDDKAAALWQEALRVDALHGDALLGMAGVWRRAGRTEAAAAALDKVLQLELPSARRAAVYEELAAVRAAQGDAAGQRHALREALRLHPGGPAATEARRTLARLLVEDARAQRNEDGPEYPEAIKEAAQLLGAIAREGGTERAQDFAAAALSLWPGEPQAFQIAASAAALRHGDLATLRIRFLSANPESPLAPKARLDLADGYAGAGRVEDAIAVLSAAAQEDPAAALRLQDIYARAGRNKDLAALLDSLPQPEDPKLRLSLLRRRAAAQRTAGDRAAWLALLRQVLDLCPDDSEALAEVTRDLRLKGALDELCDRLRAAAGQSAARREARYQWWREVALLCERHLQRVDEATEAWCEALVLAEEEEARVECEAAILRLLERGQRWGELLDRLERDARNATSPPERRDRWMRWATLLRQHRDDPKAEAEAIARVWREYPRDSAVALALLDARRRADDMVGVTEVLRARVSDAPADQAASRWAQLAGHLEQMADGDGALDAWRKARQADPALAMAWQAEERLLEQRGRTVELLDVLQAHAAHPVAAGRSAGKLYAQAAQLAFALGDDEASLDLADRALRLSPQDASMHALVESLRGPRTGPVDTGTHEASPEPTQSEADEDPARDADAHASLTSTEEQDEPTGIVPLATLDAADDDAADDGAQGDVTGDLTGELAAEAHGPGEGVVHDDARSAPTNAAPHHDDFDDGAEDDATGLVVPPATAERTGEYPRPGASVQTDASTPAQGIELLEDFDDPTRDLRDALGLPGRVPEPAAAVRPAAPPPPAREQTGELSVFGSPPEALHEVGASTVAEVRPKAPPPPPPQALGAPRPAAARAEPPPPPPRPRASIPPPPPHRSAPGPAALPTPVPPPPAPAEEASIVIDGALVAAPPPPPPAASPPAPPVIPARETHAPAREAEPSIVIDDALQPLVSTAPPAPRVAPPPLGRAEPPPPAAPPPLQFVAPADRAPPPLQPLAPPVLAPPVLAPPVLTPLQPLAPLAPLSAPPPGPAPQLPPLQFVAAQSAPRVLQTWGEEPEPPPSSDPFAPVHPSDPFAAVPASDPFAAAHPSDPFATAHASDPFAAHAHPSAPHAAPSVATPLAALPPLPATPAPTPPVTPPVAPQAAPLSAPQAPQASSSATRYQRIMLRLLESSLDAAR
jgi:tetratricopeptide (TPR) repeat protein